LTFYVETGINSNTTFWGGQYLWSATVLLS